MKNYTYRNVPLKEVLDSWVDWILSNYKSPKPPEYYYQNGNYEFVRITELDLMSDRFYTEDGDFSEFEWELKESSIYVKEPIKQ